MAQPRVTLKDIYKNAFGENFEGLQTDQRIFVRDAFDAYGENFQNAPEQKADITDFNQMLVSRLDEGERQQLQEKTQSFAKDNGIDLSDLLSAGDPASFGAEILCEILGAVADGVIDTAPARVLPAVEAGIDVGAEAAADAFSTAADPAVADAADVASGLDVGDMLSGAAEALGEAASGAAEVAGDVAEAAGSAIGEILSGLG